MDSTLFDELEQALRSDGPGAALSRLRADLRQKKEYHRLFYALLMEKRHQMGVSPIPTGPSRDIPESKQSAYEDAIRQAGRQVGELYLKEGKIPEAWPYYRIINEPEAVRTALESYEAGEGDDIQPLVQIAFYEGVHPRKGFDWILQRFGICNAITTLGGQELPFPDEDKQYCLRQLVRALYEELRDRLTAEITRTESRPPDADAPPGTPGVVRKLIQGRDWLFQEDFYHIDVSHLSSVVQMSIHLPPGPEMDLARELCAYGQRLSGRFQQAGDPPFENLYVGHEHYLGILAGDRVEEGLAYFRSQVENNNPEEVGTYPAEVLVNLLLRLDRPAEALTVARRYLAAVDDRRLTCPSLTELCEKANDYRTLAEVAREQGDPVHFLAGLLGAQR